MIIELSPTTYRTLCGLVADALSVESDASILLQNAQRELDKMQGYETLMDNNQEEKDVPDLQRGAA